MHVLYDCLFKLSQCDVALQCCGGKDCILLVELQKQLEVCHNHTLNEHTSIDTSRIKFDYDNITYLFNINAYLDCNGMISTEGIKDALGVMVGNYP